jgi:hypothetical protein
MDVPLESSLTSALLRSNQPGRLAGRDLEQWNTAYGLVESYFNALRVHNKVLLGQLVLHVLDRALKRAPQEPDQSIPQLAADEMDCVVREWFLAVLAEPSSNSSHLISTRGRLSLFLVDMPVKWQDQFLRPGPWPEEFVAAMRETYLRSGPDFQTSQLAPRPLDLGPINTLTSLSRLPYFRMAVVWFLFIGSLIMVFLATHGYFS